MSQPDTNPTMEKLRVLNLEDDENDSERIRAELETGWKEIELMRVNTREAFVRALEEFKPDVILCDFQLPGFDSSSALDLVRQTHPDIPVIIITDTLADSEVVKLLRMGARDYVMKDRLQRLVPAIRDALLMEQGIRVRKAAEKAVRQNEANIRALIEHSPVAMLIDVGVDADTDEKILMMNQKFTELFGYTMADVPDVRHWWQLAYPDEKYREGLKAEWTRKVEKAIQNHGSIEPMEVTVVCKDGSNRYVRISLASIRSQNILAFEDLTERKKLEELLTTQYQHLKVAHERLLESSKQLQLTQSQLLHSAKMASIGLLAAGVAHEINNPIGYVNSNMGTLEKYLADIFAVIDKFEAIEMLMGMLVDADDPLLVELRQFKEQINLGYIREDIKALLAESHQGLERVKKIVLDLKNFSHADSEDQWMWADMHHVLDTTLNVMWNELKYKCEVVKEFGVLPEIYCLPSQLEQVFMNLLENAAQAIEVRGKITIRTGQEGDRIWVEVSDTGKGIPPEDIPHLFDPFFTTKSVGKGTGLGLSVSYRIVKKHHGKIEVRSEVGKGSVFRVWLPVQQPDIKEKV